MYEFLFCRAAEYWRVSFEGKYLHPSIRCWLAGTSIHRGLGHWQYDKRGGDTPLMSPYMHSPPPTHTHTHADVLVLPPQVRDTLYSTPSTRNPRDVTNQYVDHLYARVLGIICYTVLHCVTECWVYNHLTKCWVLFVVLCCTMLWQEEEGRETASKRACVGATSPQNAKDGNIWVTGVCVCVCVWLLACVNGYQLFSTHLLSMC